MTANINNNKYDMNLKLGKYLVTIGKGQDRVAASQVAASAGGMLPWPPGGAAMIYPNAHQNVHELLQLVRETVAVCMHARSEAIGRGVFHAWQVASLPPATAGSGMRVAGM